LILVDEIDGTELRVSKQTVDLNMGKQALDCGGRERRKTWR
jgi:hypothetical protein